MGELSEIPASHRIGTAQTVRRSDADHPAPTWTRKLYLRGASAAAITITATADGADHLLSFTTALFAAATAGIHFWSEQVNLAGQDPIEVASGQLTLLPSLATGGALQDPLEKKLAALEAYTDGILVDGIEQYTIEGTQVQYVAMAEVWKEISRLRRELAKKKGNLPLLTPIEFNFTRMGGH